VEAHENREERDPSVWGLHCKHSKTSQYILYDLRCLGVVTLGEISWGGGVDWIHPAQDRDRWRTVVNAVMNLQVLAPRS
jgi:hypothetical protein